MGKHKKRERVDAVFISDLHIGSDLFKEVTLQKALKHFWMERLVLVGDIIDNTDLRDKTWMHAENRTLDADVHGKRVPRKHLDVAEEIGDYAHDGAKVVYVAGNHDWRFWRLVRAFHPLFKARVHLQEYHWKYKGIKIVAIHGDQFDSFCSRHKWVSHFAMSFYEWLQKRGPKADALCSLLKTESKVFTHSIDQVANGAIQYGLSREAKIVICGHTHHAEWRIIDGVLYVNAGCWTMSGEGEYLCSLVTIGEKGVRIHYFDKDGNQVKVEQCLTF